MEEEDQTHESKADPFFHLAHIKDYLSHIKETLVNTKQANWLSSFSLDEKNSILSLNLNNLPKRQSEVSIIEELNNILEHLSMMNFTKLTAFEIRLCNYEGTISSTLINSVLHALSSLKNLSHLKIIEESDSTWNPYTLFLFSSFEITPKMQACYTYESTRRKNSRMILISQEFNKKKALKYSVKYTSLRNAAFYLMRDNSMISDLSICLQNLYRVASAHRNLDSYSSSDSSSSSLSFPAINSKQEKKVSLLLNFKEHQLFEQILSAVNLFRIWDYDYNRIISVKFNIISCTEQNIFCVQKPGQSLDLQDLVSIRIFNKLHLSYPILAQNQVDLFQLLIQSAKGITINEMPMQSTQLQMFISLLNQHQIELPSPTVSDPTFHNNQNEMFQTLEQLNLRQVTQVSLNELVQFASLFPALKKLCILIGIKNQSRNVFLNLDSILKLVSRLSHLNICNQIVLRNKRLGILLADNMPEVLKTSEQIPYSISRLEQAKHVQLTFEFRSQVRLIRKNVISLVTNLIRSPSVIELEFFSNIKLPHLEIILSKRNSELKQIVGYYHSIRPFMTYDPQQILWDLYDN